MNDFLQSLRGGQKDKRTGKTRRSFDNGNFNSAPNFQNHGNYQGPRTGNMKRSSTRGAAHVHIPGNEHQTSFTPPIDPLDVMLDLLDVYTKNQEMLISVQEKRIIAEERKAIALEEIAEYLRVITMPSFHESGSLKNQQEEPVEAEEADSEVAAAEGISPEVVEPEEIDEDSIGNAIQDDEVSTISYRNNVDEEINGNILSVQPDFVETVEAEDYNIENDIDDQELFLKPAERNIPQRGIKKSVTVIRRKKNDSGEELYLNPKEKRGDLFNEEEIRPQEQKFVEKATPRVKEVFTEEAAEKKKSRKDEKKLLSREAVMDIIHSMRAQGKTFDEVAQHLVSLGQPTFSGRGEWHAQTIHRLCNKKGK